MGNLSKIAPASAHANARCGDRRAVPGLGKYN